MSTSDIKNVLIVGAAGNLGETVLSTFLQDPSFNVTVLTRPNSTTSFAPTVRVVKADYSSPLSSDDHNLLTTALKDQDAVISLVGAFAIGDQINLINAAVAAGVKRFIPSEFGGNTDDEKFVSFLPFFKQKREVVEYLMSQEGRGKGKLSWSAVVTGAFFDWGLRTGFLGFDVSSKTATLIDAGTARITTTTLPTIARALISILHPTSLSLTANKYIPIASFSTTQNGILASLQHLTNEKWTINHVNSEDLIKSGREKIEQGDYSGNVDLLMAGLYGKMGLGDYEGVEGGLWNQRLGLEGEEMEESVRAVLEEAQS